MLILQNIKNDVKTVLEELLTVAKLEKGDILVVGCSSSEVAGQKIGTYSSEEIGKVIFETLNAILSEKGIFLACQCCEHLNRALIIEKELAKADGDSHGYDLRTIEHRYFVVDKFHETDYKKITPRAPMGTRIFDLTQVLNTKDIPEVAILAEKLKELTWS